MDFAFPANHKVKLKESEKKDKHLNLARELKKTLEHESGGGTNCKWRAQCCYQRVDKSLEDLEIIGRVETIKNDSIIKIG